MRKFVSVVLVLLICLISCAAAPPLVRLCVKVPGRAGISCGTGTTASDTPYILTAYHVVDDLQAGAKMMIKTALDTIVVARCDLFTDTTSDVAIIRVPTVGDSLPLCLPEVGESVSIYSLDKIRRGFTLFVTDTTVYIDAVGDEDNYATFGNSGSPIVSDERGCIVGLLTAILWSKDSDGNRTKYIWSTGVSSEVIMWLLAEQAKHDAARMATANKKEQPDAGTDTDTADATE